MSGEYDDIINMEHHVSVKRKHMSIRERAAQFSSYAALTGYEDAIQETARTTNKKIELDEYLKEILNQRITQLSNFLKQRPKIIFVFYLSDKKKSGGEYITVEGYVKKIDRVKRVIVLHDNKKIPVDDILEIKSEDIVFI